MKKLLTVSAVLASVAAASVHAQGQPAAGSAAPQASTEAKASSPAKKELAAKIVQLQLPGIEGLARQLVEQSASQLLQQAGQGLQQVPQDKRDAVAQAINTSAKKYVDDTVPLVRDRAVKLAPSTLGGMLEAKFTEDELKQLLAWLESPVSRKYQQAVPEMQSALVQKLVAEASPVVDPKLRALDQSVRQALGLPAGAGSAGKSDAPAAAKPPSRPASK